MHDRYKKTENEDVPCMIMHKEIMIKLLHLTRKSHKQNRLLITITSPIIRIIEMQQMRVVLIIISNGDSYIHLDNELG